MVNDRLLTARASPHVRTRDTTRGIMLDVLIALVPALVASVVLFGIIIIGSLVIRYVLNEHEPKPGKRARKGAIK